MKDRYERNRKTLSVEDNQTLKYCKVCVAGCGGLGGYVIELLGRIGVGTITAVDGDVFDVSNLNRQLLSDETVIGKSKAHRARERMALVNSEITVLPIEAMLNEDNCRGIIADHHLVVDALDNIRDRKLLQRHCEALGIPLVHGAIAGWYAQVTTIMPGDKTFDIIYSEEDLKGLETELGNPSFTPALAASIQVAEAIKVLLGKEGLLRNKLLIIDLLRQEYEVLTLN